MRPKTQQILLATGSDARTLRSIHRLTDDADDKQSSSTVLDFLIIGAGPAGLQLGSLMEREKMNYLIVERNKIPGSFFARYPRHRTLISINKRFTGKDNREFNMRHDWNALLVNDSSKKYASYRDYSPSYWPNADTMVDYLEDFAKGERLKIRYNFAVETVARPEGSSQGFVVRSKKGSMLIAKRLVLATGLPTEKLADIPGKEHVETYGTVDIDPSKFRNQSVLIIGKGNAAFELANNLSDEHAALVHVASRRNHRNAYNSHYVGDLRAVNNK